MRGRGQRTSALRTAPGSASAALVLGRVALWLAGVLSCANGAAGDPDLTRAWSEVGYVNYRGAAADFEAARRTARKGSDRWVEATMGLALCLQHRQPDVKSDKELAAELLDSVVSASQGTPVQAVALLLRARLADQVDYYGDEPDSARARRLYERIIRDWPEAPVVHRAALYRSQLGVFSMTEQGARRGVREMESWLAAHPANPLAHLQWLLIGRAYMEPLGSPLEAVLAFRQAEAVGLPRHTRLDSFYWLVANLSERGDDVETAAVYYERIITAVRRSSFAFEAHERLRALGRTPPPLVDPFAGGAPEEAGEEP